MKEKIDIVQLISAMLAPGIMISACGLLILGMNNKYSIVVNRIRLLNEERRRLFSKIGEKEFSYEQNVRAGSINMQLGKLVKRLKFVRNAVVCYTSAVALFVLTSLIIGAQYFSGSLYDFSSIITVLFLLGMFTVFVGITYATKEALKGYSIVALEVKIDE